MQDDVLFRRIVFSSFYVIKSYCVDQVFNFVDLEVTMDPKLNFSLQVNTMVLKAEDVLSFVKT